MNMIDISMDITPDMAVYKNRPEKRPAFRTAATHAKNGVQETEITMNVHTGTHVDAPRHIIENGKTMKDMDLSAFFAPCRVLDFTHVSGGIGETDLKQKIVLAGEFILLRTKNSDSEAFDFEFVYLKKDGAEYLKKKGVIGVGIDALGIERGQPDHDTHYVLLGSGIPIIEGLRLKGAAEGEYTLAALPLKLPDADAAPMRAVLLPAGLFNP